MRTRHQIKSMLYFSIGRHFLVSYVPIFSGVRKKHTLQYPFVGVYNELEKTLISELLQQQLS